MANFQLMKAFQHIDVLGKFIHFPCGDMEYIEGSESVFENYLLTDILLKENDLPEIEAKFLELKRKSAIYFENREDLLLNKEFLKNHGYTNEWNDSWFFYEDKVEKQTEFQKVKKVETSQDLEVFLDVFNNSYQKDDPQNPYGDVLNYLPNTKSR